MRYGLAALIAGLAFAVGCGDDNAGSGRVELTVQNASGEQIAVYINGEQTQLDDGQ